MPRVPSALATYSLRISTVRASLKLRHVRQLVLVILLYTQIQAGRSGTARIEREYCRHWLLDYYFLALDLDVSDEIISLVGVGFSCWQRAVDLALLVASVCW
jgi:hypothetical protein